MGIQKINKKIFVEKTKGYKKVKGDEYFKHLIGNLNDKSIHNRIGFYNKYW